ncbi:hypothetical protein M3231_17995 [Neobacillus mesonae]|nr:hypothetical protein [Neobacillus mesonae]
MYQVGDRIFYPMYGAGFIQSLEEKEILGEKSWYFEVHIEHPLMDVSIPVEKAGLLGIRCISDEKTLLQAKSIFSEECGEIPSNPNARHQFMLNKLKTGDICMEIQVIRDLSKLMTRKTLGWSDKTMLNNARKLVISELVYARNISPEQASDMLDNSLVAVN